jgi:hypothetical protein
VLPSPGEAIATARHRRPLFSFQSYNFSES